MRVEGVYTYLCDNCETLFAVVSRFSVNGDRSERFYCPKCAKPSYIIGEGFIKHQIKETFIELKQSEAKTESLLPELLTVEHVSEYMNVSKRVAYEFMDRKDFPLIRIRRSKRVNREDFFHWLSEQKQGAYKEGQKI